MIVTTRETPQCERHSKLKENVVSPLDIIESPSRFKILRNR